MITLVLAQLWSVIPCQPLGETTHPKASGDSVEFCSIMEQSYKAINAAEHSKAYEAAKKADALVKFEWETDTPILLMAKSSCASGQTELGLRHIDTFICAADISTQKIQITDWFSREPRQVKQELESFYPSQNGWKVDFDYCYWALEDAFPNDFDQASQYEVAALYREAYAIKAACHNGED